MKKNSRLKKWIVRVFFLSLVGVIFSITAIFFSNKRIVSNAEGKAFETINGIDKTKVALVLGASAKSRNGNKNLYFVNRINAAAELYHKGKVEYLLVSGDNSRKAYDEPTDMKKALIDKGVPADKIYMDYAGFRTWDSIIRCKEIFGQQKFIIVSQQFHNERAIYIAEHFDCEVQAYNAKNVKSKFTSKREYLARVKLFVDMLMGKKAKFLGDKIVIGEKQKDINA